MDRREAVDFGIRSGRVFVPERDQRQGGAARQKARPLRCVGALDRAAPTAGAGPRTAFRAPAVPLEPRVPGRSVAGRARWPRRAASSSRSRPGPRSAASTPGHRRDDPAQSRTTSSSRSRSSGGAPSLASAIGFIPGLDPHTYEMRLTTAEDACGRGSGHQPLNSAGWVDRACLEQQRWGGSRLRGPNRGGRLAERGGLVGPLRNKHHRPRPGRTKGKGRMSRRFFRRTPERRAQDVTEERGMRFTDGRAGVWA